MKVRSEIINVPVFIAEVSKRETPFGGLDEIIAHYRREIERHPCACYIGLFNHYAHTRELPDGEIADDIVDALNIVFCFGMSLPDPEVMAMRPRSIGIAEMADRYVITFLEPPMPLANTAIEAWTRALGGPADNPCRTTSGADVETAGEAGHDRNGAGGCAGATLSAER